MEGTGSKWYVPLWGVRPRGGRQLVEQEQIHFP